MSDFFQIGSFSMMNLLQFWHNIPIIFRIRMRPWMRSHIFTIFFILRLPKPIIDFLFLLRHTIKRRRGAVNAFWLSLTLFLELRRRIRVISLSAVEWEQWALSECTLSLVFKVCNITSNKGCRLELCFRNAVWREELMELFHQQILTVCFPELC